MGNFAKFKQYLHDQDLHFEEDIADGIPFVHMREQIKNAATLLIIFDFDVNETIATMHIYNVAKIDSPLKRDELLRLVNDLNNRYRFVKYIVTDNGDVSIEYSTYVNESYDFSKLIFILFLTIKALEEEELKKFMRLQWA